MLTPLFAPRRVPLVRRNASDGAFETAGIWPLNFISRGGLVIAVLSTAWFGCLRRGRQSQRGAQACGPESQQH